MKDIIRSILEESLRIKRAGIENHLDTLLQAAGALTECITRRHRIFIFGNGGSAADAQHLAAEFVNRFRIERTPLPAMALTTDTSVLTSIANDYSFEDVFSKQIAALGTNGDLAWGISTSGQSKNVVKALEAARGLGITTLAMTGRGGQIAALSDLLLTVDAEDTARIQETHITMGHILCELVERMLYPDQF